MVQWAVRLRTALIVVGLLSGCVACSPARHAPAPSASTGSHASIPSSPVTTPAGSVVSLHPSARPGTPSGATSGAGRTSGGGAVSGRHGPRVLAPAGTNISGVICDYVSQSEVRAVLPGAGAGQENDLAPVAVSYCNFNASPYGTVSVGVKNMGTASSASGEVHGKYATMSAEPDQATHTFAVAGRFAFTVSSATPLASGKTIYAVNAQGSRGGWYVSIQYYAHAPCPASAMQRLLGQVLSHVPA